MRVKYEEAVASNKTSRRITKVKNDMDGWLEMYPCYICSEPTHMADKMLRE